LKKNKKYKNSLPPNFQLKYDMILDFHGYSPEKALLELEEKIFCAMPQNSILVVHGLGSGVLKNSIRDFIRCNKLVSHFEYGEETNLPGGAGVTLVYT
jgi:dsDNA-specific endonuclease/ATPase MutS2